MASPDVEPAGVLAVSAELSGSELLEFVSSYLINHSKTKLRRLIGAGRIRLNGLTARPGRRVREGDLVSLPPGFDLALPPEQTVPIGVLYEDRDLLCLDKPAGHPVLPGRGGQGSDFFRSLTAALNRGAPPGGPYVRPHLVHRLDRETSGVLLVAKTVEAGRRLSRQFERRQVTKHYVALSEGVLPRSEVTVDIPLSRERGSLVRMAPDLRRGKPASTLVRIRERFGHFSLLDVRPLTGRQHQIRTHLAAIGYPLAVDALYGRRDRLTGAEFNRIVGKRTVRDDEILLGRCALHAATIRYEHPRTGEPQVHASPLPDDLRRLLALLRRADRPR